jgi:hypothetical protein
LFERNEGEESFFREEVEGKRAGEDASGDVASDEREA